MLAARQGLDVLRVLGCALKALHKPFGVLADVVWVLTRDLSVQTPLVGLAYAFATFLYQFQILLKDNHEINWIVSIAILYSDTEFRRQVQWQCLGINSVCCRIRAVLCSSGVIIV